MTEVRFYHLTTRRLEDVLPVMLERCLERGWRAVVRGADPDRLAALDAHLWTWKAESFLPHGTARDGDGAGQPIWLTDGADLPNAPAALFLVDGAPAEDQALAAVETAALLFDGRDAQAVAAARDAWRRVVAAGHEAVYWAEGPRGWERRASSAD